MAAASRGAPRGRGVPEEERRDWAGLPEDLLVKVAETLVAQDEAAWAAWFTMRGLPEEVIQKETAAWRAQGKCLFIFARVCKEWRKAQRKVRGPLCTRVRSDVLQPGGSALAKWALAEGCPRESGYDGTTMAEIAAEFGHLELLKWLCGEGGSTMDARVMMEAAGSGNMELVQWLRAEGCPWDKWACENAVHQVDVDMLRWLRANGCEWDAKTRDMAAEELGYTDDFGNLVEEEESDGDDEYGYGFQGIAWLEEEVGWDSESDHE